MRIAGGQRQFTPLAGTCAVSLLKAGVEKSQMIEPALLGDIDDFLPRISKQGYRFEQAYFHPQGRYRKAKMLMKQTVQVPATSAKPHRQFIH